MPKILVVPFFSGHGVVCRQQECAGEKRNETQMLHQQTIKCVGSAPWGSRLHVRNKMATPTGIV